MTSSDEAARPGQDDFETAHASGHYENRISYLEKLSESVDSPDQFKWMGKRMKGYAK